MSSDSSSLPNPPKSGLSAQMSARTIGLLVLVAAAIIFILQNRVPIDVKFLWLTIGMPLWVFIIVLLALGALIDRLAGWLIRRSRSSSDSAS